MALAVELALPFLAARAPLALRARLPPPLYILGEASKSRLVPRDWVLVLGDSYAAGGGDWLIEQMEAGGNPPFQATDVLHELSGRDVLTFGNGGADNVTATAYLASKRFAALRRTGLADPSDVVVYFYEGNDLNDNLRLARRRFGLGERSPSSYTDEELDLLIDGRARKGRWQGLGGALYGPYALHKLVKDALEDARVSASAGAPSRVEACGDTPFDPETDFNRVAAGDRSYRFTNHVQGPGLELSGEERDLALRLLERSLAWVARRFQGARLTVAYLPSPLACYELASPRVRVQSYEARGDLYSTAELRARSDEVRERVAAIARARGFGFLDTTSALREAARGAPVHGPIDGQHLNRRGYEVVGEALAQALARHGAGT